MRTGSEYLQSLSDERTVILDGARVRMLPAIQPSRALRIQSQPCTTWLPIRRRE